MTAQTLHLRPNHPCNTRITDADTGDRLYTVHSKVDEMTGHTSTEVRRGGSYGEVIALFEWREFRSDLLTFGSNDPVRANEWIKNPLIPFKESISFSIDPWKAFKWKNYGSNLSPELYEDDDKTTPIARFRRPILVGDEILPASLEIMPRATSSAYDSVDALEDWRDRVVISFLYIEKLRRTRDEDEFSPMSRALKF
ncbi:hypothetical protein PLICRDRAFT_52512 [Plicaturopsis crispa FD-325 SS-3]|nr:hypothetical protein PLICRDRAFT_52512 [Plicaturopsis crispa FD-325 SS-3]